MQHESPKNSAKNNKIYPKKGQSGFSCCNEVLYDCPFLGSGDYTFTGETIEALGELGEVFLKIHKRLLAEGYTIEHGQIKKLDVIKF